MKLNSRRKAYEVSAPINHGSDFCDSIKKPKIKLTYNGNTFDYIPRPPIVVSEDDTADWSTVTLIYRGNVFERKLPPPKPYQKPRAINWRWRFDKS